MNIVTVTCTMRPSMWENIVNNILRQFRKPDHCFIMYHKTIEEIKPFKQRIEDAGIPVTCWRGSDDWNLSTAFLHAFKRLNEQIPEGTFACVMDDDDWYGWNYLFQLEVEAAAHPEAFIIGKSQYWARWIETDKTALQTISAADFVPSVAGPTISINMDAYRKHPNFRHDPDNYWADTSIIKACHDCGGLIYNTGEAEFFLQRYPESHGHGWKMPEP